MNSEVKKATIIISLVVFLLVGVYFGLGSLSIIGSTDDVKIPYSCLVPDDCSKAMISDGAATQSSIDKFKLDYDIKCESKQCVGVKK